MSGISLYKDNSNVIAKYGIKESDVVGFMNCIGQREYEAIYSPISDVLKTTVGSLIEGPRSKNTGIAENPLARSIKLNKASLAIVPEKLVEYAKKAGGLEIEEVYYYCDIRDVTPLYAPCCKVKGSDRLIHIKYIAALAYAGLCNGVSTDGVLSNLFRARLKYKMIYDISKYTKDTHYTIATSLSGQGRDLANIIEAMTSDGPVGLNKHHLFNAYDIRNFNGLPINLLKTKGRRGHRAEFLFGTDKAMADNTVKVLESLGITMASAKEVSEWMVDTDKAAIISTDGKMSNAIHKASVITEKVGGSYIQALNNTNVDLSKNEGVYDIQDNVLVGVKVKTLKKYTIPNGVEVIGMNAFSNTYNKVDIVLPSSLKVIKKYAFYRASIRNLKCYSEAVAIEDNAFQYLYVDNIDVVEEIIKHAAAIGDAAFWGLTFHSDVVSNRELDMPKLISIGDKGVTLSRICGGRVDASAPNLLYIGNYVYEPKKDRLTKTSSRGVFIETATEPTVLPCAFVCDPDYEGDTGFVCGVHLTGIDVTNLNLIREGGRNCKPAEFNRNVERMKEKFAKLGIKMISINDFEVLK